MAKYALVTGSTLGIGFETVTQLAKRKELTVIINGRTQEKVDNAVTKAREIVGTNNIEGIAADVSQREGVEAIIKKYPTLQVLVNNTGFFEPVDFFEITDEKWQEMFEINVMSGVRLSRYYLKEMLKNNSGRIVFISSESGLNVSEEMVHYGFSKTGQLAVAAGMAKLCKGTNVTVNSVLPGPTLTEGVKVFVKKLADSKGITFEEAEKDFFKTNRSESLLQRFLRVDEVANLITYVCSEEASGTIGASLRVEGGMLRGF